jgi:Flp pilus assembly protein protease CpaA
MESLTSLTIGNNVTNIGGYAFYNMKSLTTLVIPDSVTNIGNNAFFGMEDLTSIQISNSLTVIKDAVFYGMESLTSLTIPSSVTEIQAGAFRFMEKLTSLTIPNNVTSIGNSAFEGMSKLKSLSIPNSVTTIGLIAFASMSEISEIRYCGNQIGVTSYFSTNYPSIPISSCAPPVVIRLTPTITWATPASITTAEGLSAKQLNATVVTPNGLDGVFRYTPAIGTKLAAGTQELSVTFTPADSSNFNAVTTTVKIEVTPAIVAATASITGLSATYSGTSHAVTVTTSPAALAYSLTYNGSNTAPTNAGSYTVVATITQAGYSGSATATLVIAKATPTITWAIPASITTADSLSTKQLNATASVAGVFTYTPAIGTKSMVGKKDLSVSFVPTDSINYTSVVANNSIVVKVAPPVVTATIVLNGATKKLNTKQLKLITTKAAQTGSIVRVFGYVTKTKDSIKDSNQSLARAVTVRTQIRNSWPLAKIKTYGEGSTSEPLCAGVKNLCTVVKVYDK